LIECAQPYNRLPPKPARSDTELRDVDVNPRFIYEVRIEGRPLVDTLTDITKPYSSASPSARPASQSRRGTQSSKNKDQLARNAGSQ